MALSGVTKYHHVRRFATDKMRTKKNGSKRSAAGPMAWRYGGMEMFEPSSWSASGLTRPVSVCAESRSGALQRWAYRPEPSQLQQPKPFTGMAEADQGDPENFR